MAKGNSKLGSSSGASKKIEPPKSFKNVSELKSFAVKSGVKLTKEAIHVLKLLDALEGYKNL